MASRSVSAMWSNVWWQAHIRPVVAPFLISRIIVLILAVLTSLRAGTPGMPDYYYLGPAPLATLTDAWDAVWYAEIAENGYSTSPDTSQWQNYAFFPLYPTAVRAAGDISGLSRLDGGYNIAGTVISHLFFFVALVLLYGLTKEVWSSEKVARRAIWLYAALPWAYVFSMPYTESLFLMLATAAMWLAFRATLTHGRDHWLVLFAGLSAAGVALTRPQGIMLAGAAAWLVAVTPRSLPARLRVRNAVVVLLPAVIAITGFVLYIGARTGGLTAVVEARNAWGTGWLYDPLYSRSGLLHVGVLGFLALVIWIALTIWLVRVQYHVSGSSHNSFVSDPKWAFVMYALLYLAATVLTNPINSSWGRYMLAVFPCVWPIALSSVLEQERTFRVLVQLFLGLQAMLFAAMALMYVTP